MAPEIDSYQGRAIPERGEPARGDATTPPAAACFASADALPPFATLPFDRIPAACRARVHGVDYACLTFPDGGQLFVTRHGWPRISTLRPEHWYAGKRYRKQGRLLPGATSPVYKVSSAAGTGRSQEMVIKFCRFAQEVPISVRATFNPGTDSEAIDAAKFNGPFEEFGILMDLRRGLFGPPALRILTKRPLAIYCPPERFSLWQLGRNPSRFSKYQHLLELDQQRSEGVRIRLEDTRMYILLFGWVDGQSAEELYEQGALSEAELRALTHRVTAELRAKGFAVLDNKPKHFILRRRRDGSLLRRGGELVYLLVDFELLKRTEEYEAFLAEREAREHGQASRDGGAREGGDEAAGAED